MLLLIDNYDSFTYNLYHAFSRFGIDVELRRNDALSYQDCLDLEPSHLVIGPGPGNPSHSGISLELLENPLPSTPTFGVCLGMQCLAAVYGGKVVKNSPVHGKLDQVFHDQKGVFHGLPQGFLATRYHSFVVDEASLPPCIEVSARNKQGVVMGIRHSSIPLEGVQFHPESILSEEGSSLIENFLFSG
jgi:para-aminobenzoate synthetase component 2